MFFEDDCREMILAQDNSIMKLIKDYSKNYNNADFHIWMNKKEIWIECKEKKSRNRKEWSEVSNIDIDNIFILDETSLKMIFQNFPNFVIIIRDNTRKENKFIVFDGIALLNIPKTRVKRQIERNEITFKGKWIIDLNHGKSFKDIHDAFLHIYKLFTGGIDELFENIDSHEIPNIEIPVFDGNMARTENYWLKDVAEK